MIEQQIFGAGLAGLIAACRFKNAEIFEASDRQEQHKALLRFRDKSVSELIGIPFKEVTVHKEIDYYGATHHRCTIGFANMYSRKVSGAIRGRSIWNLDTVKRYVAPENLYDQLVDRHEDRINWQTRVENIMDGNNGQRISTIPLPVIMKACGMDGLNFEFAKAAIKVDRYRLPHGTDVYQTIYFPADDIRVFRASITGDLLIVESVKEQNPDNAFSWLMSEAEEIVDVAAAFGMDMEELDQIDTVDQKYGKIIELPREQREAILYELTRDFNVFSIGRFATWRNILLDDVVQDIAVVERLMNASTYGRGLVLANR